MFVLFNLFFILPILTSGLKIANHPVDKYAKLNERVLFSCIVEGFQADKDIVEWCKNDFCTWGRSIEMPDGRLKFKSLSKHYIVGNRQNGEWNLLIENATSSDMGQYKCTVTRRSDKLVYKINSNSANLTIMEKPISVQINTNNSLEVVLNRPHEVLCQVEGGVPEPVINWIIIDSSIASSYSRLENILKDKDLLKIVDNFNSNYEINTTILYNSTSVTHVNSLKLNGTMSLLNKTLICLVEHPLLDEPLLKKAQLDLKYPPVLSIYYEPSGPLEEDKTYTFFCKSSANPNSFINSEFYLEKRPEFKSTNGSLTIKLDRNLNGNLFICKQTNSIGASTLNYTLNILYSPKFIQNPRPIVFVNSNRTNLSLICKVDSNPKPVIYWVRNKNEVVHIGERININRNLIGEYACQARVNGFKPIMSKVSVVSDGVPNIFGDNQYFIDNDNNYLNIQFSILSSPAYQFGPICTKVTQNGSVSLEIILPIRNKDKYDVFIEDIDQLKVSSKYLLRFKELSESDIGLYNCTVTNKHGSSIFTFEIKNKVEKDNLWIGVYLSIFFGILIVILILSILILVCVQRKRAKKNQKKQSLPSVSDHSGYEEGSPKNEINFFGLSLEPGDLSEIKQKIYSTADLKALSDDRKIDNSFKKQSNQISLILDHQHTSSTSDSSLSATLSTSSTNSQNLSFESLKFPSDTQNLIMIDSLKPIYASTSSQKNIYSTSHGIYQKANIYSSKFQTNV